MRGGSQQSRAGCLGLWSCWRETIVGSPGARDRGVLTTEGQQAVGQLWWRRTERAQLPTMEMHYPAAIALEGMGWINVTRK